MIRGALLLIALAAVLGVAGCSSGGAAALSGCNLSAAVYASAEGAYTALQADMSGASMSQVQQDAGSLLASAASWYSSGSSLAGLFATYARNVQAQFQAVFAGANQTPYSDAAAKAVNQIQHDLTVCGL